MIRPISLKSRWRAAPAQEFAWAEFDGEYVLFHRRSGQTHFLNAASAALLQDILVDEVDADAACRALEAARVDDGGRLPAASEPPSTLREQVFLLLARFEDLGLVERIPG